MSSVLIIGNGFDLDLGLKTSFMDFYNSAFWPQEHEPLAIFSKINQSKRFKVLYNQMDTASLLRMLTKNPVEEWNEMEQIIEDFAMECDKAEPSASQISTHHYELKKLSESLRLFAEEAMKGKPSEESTAERVLKTLDLYETTIYSFNLTDLWQINEDLGIKPPFNVNHVHGSVDTNAIIGAGNKSPLNCEYDVFKKMFAKGYKSQNISQAMNEADDVIIFGHSLSDQDSVYFKDFFMKAAEADATQMKRITLITKNDESRHGLIRKMDKLSDGRVADLFQNNTVRIFTTEDLNEIEFLSFLDDISYESYKEDRLPLEED